MLRESLEDFRKRYKGTYVFLELNGTDYLVRYDQDNEEDFCFFSPIHGNILVDENTARELLTIRFPKTGLYNTDEDAVEFCRLPERQWKRAPAQENTIIVPFDRKINTLYGKRTLTPELAHSLFYPEYPESLDIALEIKKKTVALNHKFGIYTPDNTKETRQVLFFLSQPVAWINKNNKTISMEFKPLHQEVKDFLNSSEPEWTIQENT